MAILETLVLLLTTLCTAPIHIHGHDNNANANADNCPTSHCGKFTLLYPFKLQDMNTQNTACPSIDLTCTSDQTPTVSLRKAGQFYVRMINYYPPYAIQLQDPENCLMARLMKPLDLSPSPFQAIHYQNYTYYTCPSNITAIQDYFQPISCLSNSTSLTIATAFFDPESMLGLGCQVIGSWVIPVQFEGQFEFDGVGSDLFLTWNSSRCDLCENPTGRPAGGVHPLSLWAKFVASAFFLPTFVTMAVIISVICLLSARSSSASGNDTSFDANGQPVSIQQQPGGGGMDESKIIACTELVVISESKTSVEGDSTTCCSICLEGYHPDEEVRSINKCRHSFHGHCLQLWLTKNNNCPVCRTILSHIDTL